MFVFDFSFDISRRCRSELLTRGLLIFRRALRRALHVLVAGKSSVRLGHEPCLGGHLREYHIAGHKRNAGAARNLLRNGPGMIAGVVEQEEVQECLTKMIQMEQKYQKV